MYTFKFLWPAITVATSGSDDGGYAKNSNPHCGNTGEHILSNEPREHWL